MKLGSFDRSSLKREGRRFLEKIRPSTILWEHFKFLTPSRTVIGSYAPNWQLHCNAHTAPTAPLVLYRTRLGKCAMKNSVLITNCQLQNKHFWLSFIVSLVKAAMNALHLSKLRKDCLTGTGHWSFHNGVSKTLAFLNFPFVKGGTKIIAHLSIAEGSSFWSLDRLIYVCKLWNEKIN
jgi:hypothetical protein